LNEGFVLLPLPATKLVFALLTMFASDDVDIVVDSENITSSQHRWTAWNNFERSSTAKRRKI